MSKKGKIGQLNGVNKELCYLLRPKPSVWSIHISDQNILFDETLN